MTRSPIRIGVGVVASLVMLGAIIAANWVTTDYGFIPVGLGFEATAGTLFAGVTLAMRDLIQDTIGKRWVVALILVGTALSFALAAPFIAIASAVAFLLSELLDFAVYTPLRNRSKVGDKRWAVAVLASNTVGAVIDTVVFLGIAFGLGAIGPALPGQLVGKTWATLAYLAFGFALAAWLRHYRRTRSASRVLQAG